MLTRTLQILYILVPPHTSTVLVCGAHTIQSKSKDNSMAYQEKTTTGYGKRLTNSIKGIVGGFIFFGIGTLILFLNEGNFVKTQRALKEAQGNTTSIADVSRVDAELNGKLIHATALADTKDELRDAMFGVNTVAIMLERQVEYYQYVETSTTRTEDKIGGGEVTTTEYHYSQKWTDSPQDSSEFHDPDFKKSNSVLTTVDAKKQWATNVSFGGYKLPEFLIKSMTGSTPAKVSMTNEQFQEWEKVLNKNAPAPEPPAEPAPVEIQLELKLDADAQVPPAAPPAPMFVHVIGNVVYLGKSPNNPQIGDLRITLTQVMPAEISIIAKVVGSTFEKYSASNNKDVWRLEMGAKSAESMYQSAHSDNKLLAWVLRFIGAICVICGLKGIFNIVVTLFKVLPFLADIVGIGVGLICFVVGFAWSLLIISIAWLTYRPLIGIPLVIAAIGGIVYLKKVAAKKKAESPVNG